MVQDDGLVCTAPDCAEGVYFRLCFVRFFAPLAGIRDLLFCEARLVAAGAAGAASVADEAAESIPASSVVASCNTSSCDRIA